MGTAYSNIIEGSTIIPTDTKKIAPKRSFTGLTRWSMCSASTVSAKIDPMIKAPNAAEKPVCAAITTIKKHIANDTISNVSSLISLRVLRSNKGINHIPTTNHKIKKNPSLPMLSSKSKPSTLLLTAIVESNTISTIARISSSMRMLITN